MILSCEKCSAKYMIPNEAIGSEGRKVKCAKCQHVWMANLAAEEAPQGMISEKNAQKKTANMQSEDSQNKIKLPKIQNTRPHFLLKLLPVFLLLPLILCVFLFFDKPLRKIKVFNQVYSAIGVRDSADFVLSSASLNKVIEEGQNVFYLDLDIVNDSAEERKMPILKIAVLDENFHVIVADMKNFEDKILQPGDKANIKKKLSNMVSNAKYVSFDIGNPIELYFR